MQHRIFTYIYPQDNIKINNMEVAALLDQIHLFVPRMNPLAHIFTVADNISAHGWQQV